MPSKETDAISVVMPAELFPARPTSCGLPVVNVDVCILGDNGQKLPPGGVGEICFRGATVMQEQPGRKCETCCQWTCAASHFHLFLSWLPLFTLHRVHTAWQ